MTSGLMLTHPWYLLLLLLGPAVWWLARRSLAGLGRTRAVVTAGLRTAVVIALVLALAEVHTIQTSRSVSVAYLLDQSLSIATARRTEMFRYVAREVQSHRQAGRGDRASVIVFGREAIVEVPPVEDDLTWLTRSESIADRLAEATNLADAVRLAISILPDQGARRIVLLSDGNENVGDVRQAAAQATWAGIGLDVVAIRPDEAVNIAVEKVVVPAVARQGAAIEVRVVVRNDAPAAPSPANSSVAGRLRVTRRAGTTTELISVEDVVLVPGKNVFSLADSGRAAAGFYTYEAEFIARDVVERTLADNRAAAFTNREGEGRVLVIENVDSPGEFDGLIARLRRLQLAVDVQRSAAVFGGLPELQSYDCIVLANVARVAGDGDEVLFSDGQIEALVRSTELGSGLILLGGPKAFGAGGWAGTRLEDASPVSFTIKNAKVIPVGALALVIDKSSSMQGEKMAMCRHAAKEAARLLRAEDQVGVVAFDDEARWIVPMQLIGQRREIIAGHIGQLAANGGTNLFRGMQLGCAGLKPVDAAVKHMIVVTDGQTPPAAFEALTRDLRSAHITVSTVAVGNDADRPLLAGIAERGGGKFYAVSTPTAIPRIVIGEAMRVTKPLVYEREEGFSPYVVYPHEIVSGIGGPLPPITGFVLTEMKDNPLVEVSIRSPVPGDVSTSTILASWSYGLGRVLVLTTDAGQRWASAWTQWEHYDTFCERMVRWAMRPEDPYGDFLVSPELHEGNLRVVVTALGDRDASGQSPPVACTVTAPDGDSVNMLLRQAAPGRYVGELAVDRAGSYLLAVHPGHGRGAIRTGVVVPAEIEFRDREANVALLASLAAQKPAGGEPGALIWHEPLNESPADPPQLDTFRATLAPGIDYREAWPQLLMLATALLFLDIVVRRVTFNPAKAAAPLTQRLLRRAAPPEATRLIARLRRQKESVQAELSQRADRVRYDAVDDGQTAQADEPADTPGPRVPTPPTAWSGLEEDDSYTSRLLKAKRSVQERRPTPREGR